MYLLPSFVKLSTSLRVSVISFISTLGSIVFREGYVGCWCLKEEGRHSEQGQWHSKVWREARRNPLGIKLRLLTTAYKTLHDLAIAYLSFFSSFFFIMLYLNWLLFCSLNRPSSLPPQCFSKFQYSLFPRIHIVTYFSLLRGEAFPHHLI